MIKTVLFLLYFTLFFFSHSLFASNSASISVNDSNEISYSIYPSAGKHVLLWFYSEAGPQKNDINTAKSLAELGIEVWLIDLFESYFLPTALSSMDQIPARDLSQFIETAYKITGKTIIPFGTGRATIPLLRASRQWQADYPDSSAMPGIILMSPKFFIETPDPGLKGELMPVVKNSNELLFIMQPTQSPWYWKLDTTIPALESNGSDIYIQRIKDVRDRFYFRPDANALEQKITLQLPIYLNNAVQALTKFPSKKRITKTRIINQPVAVNTKKAKKLKPHKGSVSPPELNLLSINNSSVNLSQLKNKVILVNFWATWCPPCVHEMPSMQRLQDSFRTDDFIILGVNMAEEKTTISQFLKNKVSVNFPILMDSDGATLKRWNVFAFPTSYVIDKKGLIRYSLFGGFEWDNKESVSIIRDLVNE